MSLRTISLQRRRFLRGLGGATLGLPLLDVFAHAAEKTPPCASFVVNMNGVQQAGFGSEPERFWPAALGALTAASITADPDRATAELKDHAARLTMIRGLKLAFPDNGCGHSGAGNQILTAAKVSPDLMKNASLAMGESIDNFIARKLGVSPLALYAGRKDGYINDHVSFRGAKELRVGENNPWLAYTRMTGVAQSDTALLMRLATKRTSINDLVREEMKEVLARTDLSNEDRNRLDRHFQSVRDVETKMVRDLTPAEQMRFKAIDGKHRDNATRLDVEKMQMDLIALAFASGLTRVAFLQLGDGTDGMTYTVDGTTFPRFHLVSHRASDDGVVGDGTMPDAVNQHHKIDKIVMRQWKYLLDKLAAEATPDGGNLLDGGLHTWCNQLGTGSHTYHNIPYILAGRAGGAVKSGQYISANGRIDAGNNGTVANNKLLNAIATAVGVPVDNFGDPSLEKGVLGGVLA